MPQHVRAERAAHAGLLAVRLQDFPEPHARQPGAAARVDEQPRRRAAFQQRRPRFRQVARQPGGRLIADGHQPLLAALAAAGEIPAFEIHILLAQAHHLRDPQPRGVQQFDQRAIAHPSGLRRVGGLQQPVNLLHREELRQRFPGPRRLQIAGRVVLAMPGKYEIPIKAANAGHRPRHRSRRPPLAHQQAHVLFERTAIQPLDRSSQASGNLSKLGQVAAVAFDGMRREPPLHCQMR